MADEPTNDLELILPAGFRENLSEAERRLLRAAPKGELAVCGPNADDKAPANDPAKADGWGSEREIRADLIRWLCVDQEASRRIDARGVRVYGAKVTGELDLSVVVVPFPLSLSRCRLIADCNLQYLKIVALYLDGSFTRSVNADGTDVRGSVFFRNGFSARGEVRLSSAQIGGVLDCDGGSFKNPSGLALNADGAEVRGYVFLRHASAEGEVILLRARIGNNLECDGGEFRNPNGRALNADSAEIIGNVFLGYGFSADGEVSLVEAKIEGSLDCTDAVFRNRSGYALNAIRAEIKGEFF